jgi:D-xylose transport system permease protein
MKKISLQTVGMLAALAAVFLIFAILTQGTFLSARNLSLLSRQMAVTGMLASGMVLIIVAGQIDLSVGALAGLCGAVAALLATNMGLPVPAACLIAVIFGALLGFGQGVLVAHGGIPPFIVTLGGMLIFQGALLGLTRGVSITPPAGFLLLGQTYLPSNATWGLGAAFAVFFIWRFVMTRKVGQAGLAALALALAALFNAYEGLPLPVLWMLLLSALFWFVAVHTPFGRHLYAIGGNREAAYYAGIPIALRLKAVFAIIGATAAATGLVLTARVGAASSDAGRMMELDAIAAAVIGGSSLLGGRGSVWGAILGAAVMASLDNGLSLLNTEAFWQPMIKGIILVAAVAFDIKARAARRP